MTMASEDQSLQGWTPRIGAEVTLARVVDLAFDYRGDVTIEKTDGSELTGYIFNRDATAPQPFVELFETKSGARTSLPYAAIANIRFTGRDMAAGQSYEAWKARRESAKRVEGGL